MVNSDEEVVDIVDEEGEVLGQVKRGEAHSKGLLHPGANIFLFNSKGNIFLQKRSHLKKVDPLCWDISASEHVMAGEEWEVAAKRGIQEELGIDTDVIEIEGFHFLDQKIDVKGEKIHIYELMKLYKAVSDTPLELSQDEIAEGRFFTFEEVDQLVQSKKECVSENLINEWQRLKRLSQ